MNRPLTFAIGMLVAGTSLAEINAQAIALNCRNCHAVSEAAIPSLESLSIDAIRQMLLDYKYDKLPATLMPRIAKGYSDAELKAVAEFLGRR